MRIRGCLGGGRGVDGGAAWARGGVQAARRGLAVGAWGAGGSFHEHLDAVDHVAWVGVESFEEERAFVELFDEWVDEWVVRALFDHLGKVGDKFVAAVEFEDFGWDFVVAVHHALDAFHFAVEGEFRRDESHGAVAQDV